MFGTLLKGDGKRGQRSADYASEIFRSSRSESKIDCDYHMPYRYFAVLPVAVGKRIRKFVTAAERARGGAETKRFRDVVCLTTRPNPPEANGRCGK